jgi:hypothetical protein
MINPKHRFQSSPIESHELFEFFSDVPVRAELEGLKRQKSAGNGRLQEDVTVLTNNIYDHGSFAARSNCA